MLLPIVILLLGVRDCTYVVHERASSRTRQQASFINILGIQNINNISSSSVGKTTKSDYNRFFNIRGKLLNRAIVLPDSDNVIKRFDLNETEVVEDFKTIQELCEKFQIPILNCSCDNELILEILKEFGIKPTKEICNLNQTIPTPVTYVLEYNKLASSIYTGVTIVLIPVAFCGNCLVVIVNKNKRKLSRYDFLTTQLAVYDVIYTTVNAFLTVPLFSTNHWIYDDISCKVLPSLMTLGWLLGVGLTVIIALERFTGIMYPFKHAQNKSLISMSAVNIILALITVIPLTWHLKINKHFQTCTDSWENSNDEIIYSIYLLITYTIVPTFLVVMMYFMLIANLKAELRKNPLGFKNDSMQRKKRVQQNIRITNVLLATIIIYGLTILPQRTASLYLLLNQTAKTTKIFMKLSFLALLPYPFHLAANPIVYSIIDAKWRIDCKKLLKKMFCVCV